MLHTKKQKILACRCKCVTADKTEHETYSKQFSWTTLLRIQYWCRTTSSGARQNIWRWSFPTFTKECNRLMTQATRS